MGRNMARCLKVSLLVANALFLAIGVLLLVFGSYSFSYNDLDHYTVIGVAHWVWNIRVAIVTCGCFILLIAVLGFVGGCRKRNSSTCIIILYAVLVGLLLIGTLATIILPLVYYGTVPAMAKDKASYSIWKHYGANDSSSLAITEAVDTVQIEHGCCGWLGAGGPNVFADTPWYRLSGAKQDGRLFPDSCCTVLDDQEKLDECTKASDEYYARTMGYMYAQDCVDQFVDKNFKALKIAIAIALMASLLQISCIILAALYIKKLRSGGSSRIV